MYALKNKVQLIGHVVSIMEIQETVRGNKCIRFSLAIHETSFNTAGETITEKHLHQIVAWGRLAELVMAYCQKDTEIAVEGKLISQNHTDQQGNERIFTEIMASDILLLGAKTTRRR